MVLILLLLLALLVMLHCVADDVARDRPADSAQYAMAVLVSDIISRRTANQSAD